jgi:hypothetical protein
MGKVITFIIVFFGILLLLRFINLHQNKNKKKADEPAAPINKKTPVSAERLVQCTVCQAYVPGAEASYLSTGYRCLKNCQVTPQ